MFKFLLLLVFAPACLYAQITDTIYYNNTWRISTTQNALFYRVAEIDTLNKIFTGVVNDYFATGELFMTGQYTLEGKKNGEYNWYYGSGRPFMKGSFSNDSLVGTWEMYFSDGRLRQRIQFRRMDFVLWDLVNENGQAIISRGNGQLKQVEIGVNPTILVTKGSMQDGKPAGRWIFQLHSPMAWNEFQEEYKGGDFYVGFQRNGDPQEKYYYTLLTPQLYCPPNLLIMEKFVTDGAYRGRYYEGRRYVTTTNADGEVFTIVEEQPEYPGGMGEFYRLIAQNLTYPSEARRMGIEGRVFVQFVIQEDGSVSEVQAIKGIGAGCDQAAEQVVKMSAHWRPGHQRGKPVKVRMIIPVTFKLG